MELFCLLLYIYSDWERGVGLYFKFPDSMGALYYDEGRLIEEILWIDPDNKIIFSRVYWMSTPKGQQNKIIEVNMLLSGAE